MVQGAGKTLNVWDIEKNERIVTHSNKHASDIVTALYSSRDNTVISAGMNSEIVKFEIMRNKEKDALKIN